MHQNSLLTIFNGAHVSDTFDSLLSAGDVEGSLVVMGSSRPGPSTGGACALGAALSGCTTGVAGLGDVGASCGAIEHDAALAGFATVLQRWAANMDRRFLDGGSLCCMMRRQVRRERKNYRLGQYSSLETAWLESGGLSVRPKSTDCEAQEYSQTTAALCDTLLLFDMRWR